MQSPRKEDGGGNPILSPPMNAQDVEMRYTSAVSELIALQTSHGCCCCLPSTMQFTNVITSQDLGAGSNHDAWQGRGEGD